MNHCFDAQKKTKVGMKMFIFHVIVIIVKTASLT